jgi:hypothetical protein
MVDLILKVAQYVEQEFKGIERKFTKAPYTTHLMAVGELAHSYDLFFGYEIGLLHDLYEDTNVKPHECIEKLVGFGYNKIDASFISDTVINLTKQYIGEKWKHFDDETLIGLETYRIIEGNDITQSIKYCDIIDNIRHNMQYDKIYKDFQFKKFIKKYLPLKRKQLELMTSGNVKLRNLALNMMDENCKYFNIK